MKLSSQPFFHKNIIVKILISEFLILYYALFTWKKKPLSGVTLYKNTSYVPFMVMIIHSIVLETLAFHWWLHEKSMILSIVLLVLNIYSIFFFLADINALRLNPTQVKDGYLYLSLGLMKRTKIRVDDIETISQKSEELEIKLKKDTAAFIAKEFEEGKPQMILYMKNRRQLL